MKLMPDKEPYTGQGYSQDPGQQPRNKTWESANRWHPSADRLYPNGRLRNPDARGYRR